MFTQMLNGLGGTPSVRAKSGARRRITAFLGLLSVAVMAHAATRTLQSIEISPIGDNRVMVRLHMSQQAPHPQSFSVNSPARLAVDLPGTALALARRYRKVDIGVLRGYAAVHAEDRTRVVLNLQQNVPYTIRQQGDDVLITLAGGVQSTAVTQSLPSTQEIRAIHFHRGENGQGVVVVKLSNPQFAVDVQQENGKIVAQFSHTTVPSNLLERLDVLDFATPVRFVDSRHIGSAAEIVVTPVSSTDFEETSYQSGNKFTLSLQPLTSEEALQRQRQHPRYTGKKISLDFQSVPVRSLLQIIADVAGTNMVVSDAVGGKIAIRLDDVPWDEALHVILETKGLGMQRQNNVIFVAPLAEIAQREKAVMETRQQSSNLAPLKTEVIQINYAKASDIASLLKSGHHSILGKRGEVTVDSRTNTLLVADTPENLSDIHALIRRLDVPVRQVLIESRIVIATNNFDRQLGAQFGFSANNGILSTSGTNTATNNAVTNKLAGSPPSFDTSQSSRYNVNLPATSTLANPGTIGLALLSSKYLVDLELSALQAEGRGEVISTPRVITANAKQASIEQGVEIPYQESTSSGATSVQFKKAVLSLNVTPQITPDGRIIMDLAIRKDDVGQVVNTANGGSVPSIDTHRVNTQVLVNNGQTVVLGGIYEDTKSNTMNKVPLLGDIPILGALFRFTEHQNDRSELLVFITPKILNQAIRVENSSY